LIGRLDLGRYHAQIEAVEGRAGREHTDPHLLISLWTNRGQTEVTPFRPSDESLGFCVDGNV
jgi:hypothetical protein